MGSSERETIYVFNVEESYLFSHYFARTDIFSELQEYYDDEEYRFEVPEDDFPWVFELLEENHYKPIRVDDIEEFAVVKEQYTPHSDILQNSVMHWSRDGYKTLRYPVNPKRRVTESALPDLNGGQADLQSAALPG